jgi:hypothetical protein
LLSQHHHRARGHRRGALRDVYNTTTAVALEMAVAEPSVFVAVTATRVVEPTSVAVGVYVCAVAPEIATQFAAVASQRCHW